ncbi:hypothetical protein B0H17DRAFT_1066013 [Mycena rosella]|uniref:Uncharacterized protein n=1 Tax=Mycena rosella TaxID=1033263 RepID=A0AAD7DF13_MYCRO|nr:hypothetical protein B0H17DRAFT_1066013 [Mycena rosella]
MEVVLTMLSRVSVRVSAFSTRSARSLPLPGHRDLPLLPFVFSTCDLTFRGFEPAPPRPPGR